MMMPAVHPEEKRCLHTYRGCDGAELDQHLNLICQHFDLWQDISVEVMKLSTVDKSC